ncbi:MAG: hypothetical protein KDD60_01580 [Bdellovibrionales bacterium]|nr:hypothetical protein [Bdellovibrionales bacterium]
MARHLVEQDQFGKAVPFLVEALRWRALGSTSSELAEELLLQCAKDAQCPNQLLAIRGLRQGITASRSILSVSHDGELLEMLQKIEQEIIGKSEVTLQKAPKWNVGYQLLGQVALWLWVGCVLASIWKGVDGSGEFRGRIFLKYVAGALVSFCAWVMCLSLA